ncbi:UbiA family prenyltransferase [Methanolobus sp. ZRKC3]|uniref:UbiA family prenyltransferase n=1 Tax=Methanolobus sp. ZRKC3 TaxID=3125786 RepID=UPI0032509DC1
MHLWKELVFGGHLFAIGSVSVMLMCAAIFLLPASIEIMCISYLLFYIIYLNDYSKGVCVDKITNSGRASYLQSRGSNFILINLASCLFFVLLLLSGNNGLIITGTLILVLGLLYGNVFKDLTKKIIGFKNFYVAAVWSFMVLFFFLQQSVDLTYGALMLAFFVFLRMMNLQIMFDMRDFNGDMEEGLLTFPVRFGLQRNMTLMRIINVLSVVFMTICVLSGILPLASLSIIVVAYYAGKCIEDISSQKGQLCYVFAAFEPILWFLLVFAGNLFMQLLNIPTYML